jgi:hypothetical protein
MDYPRFSNLGQLPLVTAVQYGKISGERVSQNTWVISSIILNSITLFYCAVYGSIHEGHLSWYVEVRNNVSFGMERVSWNEFSPRLDFGHLASIACWYLTGIQKVMDGI